MAIDGQKRSASLQQRPSELCRVPQFLYYPECGLRSYAAAGTWRLSFCEVIETGLPTLNQMA